MVILATVLLSLPEGRRRKVCQTFSRSKLQHGILLTSVQFSFENSRLSRAGSFSNTAALFQQQGHSNSCCPTYIAWRILCASLVAQLVKNVPAMPETWIRSLGCEGYLPQYSGLENFIDCIIHGVTKSQTGLSNFHFHLNA